MFDIEESRCKFAESYGADAALVTKSNHDPSMGSLTFAQDYAKKIIAQYDLGNGFDVAMEASGAEVWTQMFIAMLKAGGTYK